MFLQKIKWAYRILHSSAFVVLTDESSVIQIPLANLDTFQHSFILNAQTASLKEFHDRLGDLIDEYEQEMRLLHRREKVPKKKTRSSK